MARVKLLNEKQIGKKFKKEVKRFTKDKKEMNDAARIIRNETVNNLRDGEGVDDKPLPSLKSSTIRRRLELEETNKTHGKYSAGRSNATFTGQFVKSYQVTSKGGGKFIGHYAGIHKGYNEVDGENKTADVLNSDISRGLSSRGWKLFGVTKKAKERILNKLTRFIKRR